MTQTASKTYYRPGLVFKAKPLAQGHEECCRKAVEPVYTPDGAGVAREAIPALWAEFGVYGGEYTYTDPLTGNIERGSEFRGGYFDLDAQAAAKGWGDMEKEIVARHMLTMLDKTWAQFELYSRPKAVLPWPTYDSTHHNQIATLAATLGLVGEALAYEQENKDRKSVVEALRAELNKTPESVDDLELVAD